MMIMYRTERVKLEDRWSPNPELGVTRETDPAGDVVCRGCPGGGDAESRYGGSSADPDKPLGAMSRPESAPLEIADSPVRRPKAAAEEAE